MPDKHIVTVTVQGAAGAGKSTIAAIITKALETHGITVANQDPDLSTTVVPLQSKAQAISATTAVMIEHQQLHRSAGTVERTST